MRTEIDEEDLKYMRDMDNLGRFYIRIVVLFFIAGLFIHNSLNQNIANILFSLSCIIGIAGIIHANIKNKKKFAKE